MCDCLDRLNDALAEKNTEIIYAIDIRDGALLGVYLQTEKIDPKKQGRRSKLIASFCPFCGRKYEVAEPFSGA